MALITRVSYPLPSLNHSNNNNFIIPTPPLYLNHHNRSASSSSSSGALTLRNKSSRLVLVSTYASNTHNQQASSSDSEDDEDYKPNNNLNDPYLMTDDERREWRSKIRQVISNIKPQDLEEEELPLDVDEKRTKMQDLLAQYPLVVEEDDPDWPEDADGWGFNLGRFFDKITIKNNPKKHNDDDDDDDYDSENEIVWQDDNYIRPIKDITASDWEHAVFKDISPLIVLVHHRYKRPKENEKIRDELEKAVQIIWNCRLPSPRCVAVDAVVETDLVSALKVSVFPELIFTKAGKILFRDKAIRTAEELSKIMAFFYYGAAKPPWLKIVGDSQEAIPSATVNAQP